MKKIFTFLLMALLALAGFKSWGQETLTVCDGMATEQIVPVMVNYFDTQGTISQYVIPSSEIAAMTGGEISAMKFYISYTNLTELESALSSAKVTCKLQEVSSPEVSSIQSGGTQVFFGNLTTSNSELICSFDTPYTYQGGNLLISFEVTNNGGYTWTQFYGINPTYNSAITNQGQYPNEPQKFLPKTTFTYTGGASCLAPTGLTASNITATGATISWNDNGAESYDLAYGVASTFNLENPSTYTLQNTTTSVQLSGLTAETEYKCAVKAHCGGGEESDWSDVISFLASDKIIVDFESGIPAGWTTTDASSDGTWSITTDNNHTSGGSQALCSQSYYATNDMFISPQITLGEGYWMSFYALSTYGYEEPFDIAISTTNTDPSSFTTIQDHSWGFWESSWKQFTVELGEYAGQTVYIAIRRYQSYGISLLIDDIVIEAAPAIHAITLVQPENQSEVGTLEVNPTEARKDTRINLSSNFKQYDNYGYKFTSWTVAKTCDPTTTVNVNHDWQSDYFIMPDYPVTVSAEYEQETYYALTIDNGIEHGYVYANPNEHITAGTEVNLNQNAAEGYELDEWNVYYTENPEQTIDVESSYYGASFEMPAAAVTISATFTAKELYTVSIETIGNGTVSLIDAPAENKYYQDQQVKFNVTPDAGYMINEVTYTYGGQTYGISYDNYWGYYYFTMPEAAVTINASFIMGITVHDGYDINDLIPVRGSYTDTYNTQSQFIFPAADLQDIADSKITDLIFYSANVSWDYSFSPLTWNVFMKEVDYTAPSSFLDWDNMTNVYYGTITISGSKLSIHLSTPFEYNGGNLMVGFRENEYSNFSQWTQWYGVTDTDDNRHSIVLEQDYTNTIYSFLPKTTIIYEPVVKYDITLTQPDVEVGTIAAYANGVEVSKASEGTQITLEHNFNLGYQFNYWIVNGEQISGNAFEMPANAVTVAANYEALTQYNINCATLNEGTIHAEYDGVTISEAPAGTEITLVAEANTGYSFDHFIVNGAPIDGNTYTMPDSEITVSATFLLTHTVYNGSSDNDHHPFYVYYADDFTKSNMIMPATDLADMAGGTISSMKFYVSRTADYSTSYCNSNWQVYLKEVDENETSAPIDVTTATKVYEGVIDFKVDEVIINFTEPFAYNGGNLLIATQNTTDINYSHVYFYGSDNAYGYNCSGYASNASSLNSITTWSQKSKFLPKTTFTYTYASCPAPKGLAASDITKTGATISWIDNGAQSYDLAYGPAATFDLTHGTYTLVTGLTETSKPLSGLTTDTEYKCAVKAHCSADDESAWGSICSFTPTDRFTVYDDTQHAPYEYMPFYGQYVHNSDTKSEMIYPASDLQSLSGKTIYYLTFYASVSNHDFGSDAWDIYVKEVDYFSPGGGSGYSYTNDYPSMTKVYSGPLSIVDNKMLIILSTPFVYNSQNLMICFQQTNHVSGTNTNLSWDGVLLGGNTGSMRSRGGFTGSNSSNASSPFLPKTTFTYIPSVTYTINLTQPDEEFGTISADYEQAAAGTTVTLSATPATGYEIGEWTVINSTTTEEITVTNNQFIMPAADVTVSAVFSKLTAHTVTIATVEGGTVSVSANEEPISSGTSVYAGTVLTFGNTPNKNTYNNPTYKFKHYVVTEEGSSPQHLDAGVNTYTMPNCNLTVSAVFIPLYFPTLNVDGYAATVELWAGSDHMYLHQVGGPYLQGVAAGEYVFINADDIDGYRKTITWTDSQGTHEPTLNPSFDNRPYFLMPADNNVTVSVHYAVIQKYNIALDYNIEGGTITVSPNQQVAGGDLVHIYINSTNLHFTFDETALDVTYNEGQSSVAVTTVTAGSHYQFSMPEDNVTVHAAYTEDENYAVSIVKPEGCDFNVNYEYQGQNETTGNVYCGYKVYLSNLAITSGYRFDGWNVTYKDSEEIDQPVEVTELNGQTYFVMPKGPVTITANVTKLEEHTVTVVQTLGGTITVNGHDSGTFEALEGSTINMSYSDLHEGYIFDKWIIKTATQTYQTTNSSFTMLGENLSVEALFLRESTVNDGTSTNYNVPFHQTGYQWEGSDWNYVMTRSQFIIPATDLENVYDASITDMTFYTNNNAYAFDATWKVYIKEVEYTQFEETYEYEDVTNMTQVYNGTMTIANNMMKVHFDTPYQYNDGNLMISFVQQTENDNEEWHYWYGVNSTNYSDRLSFGGYDSNNYYSNFLPKTKFSYKPSETPTQRYEITVNEVTGATLSASRNLAAAGTVITLTQETDEEYDFNNWVVTSDLGDVTVTNDQFTMPAADVTVSANVTPKQHYFVTLDDEMENGTLTLTPASEIGYMEGTTVRIEVNPNTGYKFDETYGVKAWKADDSTIDVEVTTSYSGYSITMPEYNVVISARFTALQGYSLICHVNGERIEETVYENERIQPSDPEAPAGTKFIGWVTSDIDTYSTTAPILFETGNYPTEDLDLYAVFHYADQSKWTPIYNESDLSTDGSDRVIFAYYLSGNPTIMTYYDSWHFESTMGEMNDNAEIVNAPANTTVFRPVKNNDTWKFYFDYDGSETTLADYGGSNLFPQGLWGYEGIDTWIIYYGFVYDENGYISLRSNNTFNIDDSNQARLYKEVKQEGTLNAYFTEVLSVSGNESMNEDKEVRNLLINEGASYTIDGAKLTVSGFTKNVENIAENFVVTDGGQLEHHTEGVIATFQKDIVGYNSEESIGDGWYFVANPTANPTANLTDDTSYDLYTFDPAAAAEWQNEQYENNNPIPEENIAISRGTGYLYANAANFTLEFAGALNPADGEKTIDLVYYNGGEPGREFPGFNLIGNPFSCTAYISSELDIFKLVGGSEVQISDDHSVAPCEALFVVAEHTGETVTISTTAPTGKSYTMPIVVNSGRGETLDRAILHLEGTRSTHKFMMNPDRTNISFAKNGERFASVSRGDETEIPMNFTADHKGSYTISFNTENFEEEYLHLIDVVSGDNIDLLVTPSYTFEADADEYASRFRIVFGTTDINDDPATSSEPFVYISNGNLVINNVEGTASMQIVDMLGRIVRTETVCGSYNKPHNLKAGAYVITLDGRAQRIVIE